MATVLTDARVLLNGADLSGAANKVEVTPSFAEEDASTFNSNGWKELAAGQASHEWAVEGLWDAGSYAAPDDRLWADLGLVAAWTATAAAAEGSVAYLGNVLDAQAKLGGEVGKLMPFTAKGVGSGRVGRGLLLAGAGTARTVTGNGSPFQVGAVASGQTLLAALHVCSVAGTVTPTITVKLQSSPTSGGAYVDRVTFTAATAVGSQLATLAGPVTDPWWRAAWTITGSTPSFLVAVAAGLD